MDAVGETSSVITGSTIFPDCKWISLQGTGEREQAGMLTVFNWWTALFFGLGLGWAGSQGRIGILGTELFCSYNCDCGGKY